LREVPSSDGETCFGSLKAQENFNALGRAKLRVSAFGLTCRIDIFFGE
jgi:hypothetical protein